MNVKIAFSFSALLLTGCASTSVVTTGYYDIAGKDGATLDRSISKLGPMGGHAFAATEVQIVPVQLTPLETAKGCKIVSAQYKIKAKITLPRWKDRAKASPVLRAGFDNYAAYAVVHEKTHVRIAEAAAIVMGQAVEQIPEQKTCDALVAQVKLVVDKVQRRHNTLQLEFDASEAKRIGELYRKSAILEAKKAAALSTKT